MNQLAQIESLTRDELIREEVIESLYDTTIGYDEEPNIKLADKLSPSEIKKASIIYHLFNGLMGLCIVKGLPGSGKDLFSNVITWMIKRYFPSKNILRDEKPRPLYGEYAGLFNDEVLVNDLKRMSEVARGIGFKMRGDVLDKAADDWVTEQGKVMLKNSVLYLTEFPRYCHKREPFNPMNRTMGAIHRTKRHLDMLELGTVQLPSDLDKHTALPYVDWQVTCTRSQKRPTIFLYWIEKVIYKRMRYILEPISTAYPIIIDAGKPRSELGNGLISIKPDRQWYRPETEEERIILDVIKAGYNKYENIVQLLETDGDMSEEETLDTLKELRFRKYKRVIDYPCFYGLYNSKSAVKEKTSLKVEV